MRTVRANPVRESQRQSLVTCASYMDELTNYQLSTCKAKSPHEGGFEQVARWTGLEPATPGVTGRYSNQLSYHRAFARSGQGKDWRGGRGSNPRPPA